jgi:hypothetical protein
MSMPDEEFRDNGFPKSTDRDYALYVVIGDGANYDAQLSAVHDLLQRHGAASKSLTEKIREIDALARKSSGDAYGWWEDEYGRHFYESVYQDAAHSMAAVGMLAPLIESMFDRIFCGIRREGYPVIAAHPRWQWSTSRPKWARHEWNAQYIFNGQQPSKNIVRGVIELAEATGLLPHLPGDLEITLRALFAYRNKMLHCGFEWPADERTKFEVNRNDWPNNWFSSATSGNQPWIFYLTDDFINHLLRTIDAVLDGVGTFTRTVKMPATS